MYLQVSAKAKKRAMVILIPVVTLGWNEPVNHQPQSYATYIDTNIYLIVSVPVCCWKSLSKAYTYQVGL